MTRLDAIKASPLGYAKRGNTLATARQTFEVTDGVTKPCLWPGGLAGTDDWEPVLPEVEQAPSSSENSKPVLPEVNAPSSKLVEDTKAVLEEAAAESAGERKANAEPTPPVLENAEVSLPSPPVDQRLVSMQPVKVGRESKRHRK